MYCFRVHRGRKNKRKGLGIAQSSLENLCIKEVKSFIIVPLLYWIPTYSIEW